MKPVISYAEKPLIQFPAGAGVRRPLWPSRGTQTNRSFAQPFRSLHPSTLMRRRMTRPDSGGCSPVDRASISFGATLLAATLWFRHRFHHAVEVEAAGLLARREFAEALQPHRNVTARRCQHEHAPRGPIRVTHGV